MTKKNTAQKADNNESVQELDSQLETKAELTPEENMQVQMQELESQVKTNYELYLKALAELDNFKKRAQKDHEEIVHYSNTNLIKKMLLILDDFDRAIINAEQNNDFENLYKGLTMIHKNIFEMLTSEGVEMVKAVGCEFDPQYHQPLVMEASDQKENMVIEEFQKGYIYKNRLLRPSLVKVSQ